MLQSIGPSSLAGLGILLVMAPLNGGLLGHLYMKAQVWLTQSINQCFVEKKYLRMLSQQMLGILHSGRADEIQRQQDKTDQRNSCWD